MMVTQIREGRQMYSKNKNGLFLLNILTCDQLALIP
jgi:hypothetical protein